MIMMKCAVFKVSNLAFVESQSMEPKAAKEVKLMTPTSFTTTLSIIKYLDHVIGTSCECS